MKNSIKTLRPVILLLLAGLMLLSLAGCGASVKSVKIYYNGNERDRVGMSLGDEITVTVNTDPENSKAVPVWESEDAGIVKPIPSEDGKSCVLAAKKTGYADITVTCGQASAKIRIIVADNEAVAAALEKEKVAITINGTAYSIGFVQLAYTEQYYDFVNDYGDEASYYGLDTSYGPKDLADQNYTLGDGSDGIETWRDYFLAATLDYLTENQALCEWAEVNGISLTEEEKDEVLSSIEAFEGTAVTVGFEDLDDYYKNIYGDNVGKEDAMAYYTEQALADKAFEAYKERLEYTDEEIDEYYESLNGTLGKYDFLCYLMEADGTVETVEDGSTYFIVTEEQYEEARTKAESVKAAYEELAADAPEDADFEAILNEALSAHTDDKCSIATKNYGSYINSAYREWLLAPERVKGDILAVPNIDKTGCYLIVYMEREDNIYPTVTVRHILAMAEADSDGNYSAGALEDARMTAGRIYDEWAAGEATEESFAELAGRYSEDGGTNTAGGLCEGIYKGQMVPEFDAFCFAGHEYGDTGIVKGETGSYAGYHVIFYVGEGELYSRSLARTKMIDEEVDKWYEDIFGSCSYDVGPSWTKVG